MPVMPEQVEILDACLRAIESGASTLEECVARYPNVKGLAALLRLAMAVRQQETVKMLEVRKMALERRLTQVMETRRPHRSPIGLRLLVGLAAVLIVVVLSGAGLTRIAQYAMPGDPLYGYKRTVENVELRFAGAQGQSTQLDNIANARFHEIEVLAAVRHQPLDASYLADVAQSVRAAAQADPAMHDMLYNRYQQLLDLADKASLIQPDVLGTAIASLLSPTPTTAPLTMTYTPTATPTYTPTINDTLSPTPEPTATLADTAIIPSTPTAIDTATSVPPSATSTITPSNIAINAALPATTTPVPTLQPATLTNRPTTIPVIVLPTATLPFAPLASLAPPATLTASATPLMPSATHAPTKTATMTKTFTPTKTIAPTKTFTPTVTFTYAACPSPTPTFTPTPKGYKVTPATEMATVAPPAGPCLTWTPTTMPTDIPSLTNTLESKHPTATPTATQTAAASIATETATK